MTGILVFTSEEVMIHKLSDGKRSEGRYCFWTLARMPLQEIDRLYFAIRGQVKGYFKIHEIAKADKELRFYSESWIPIPDGETLEANRGWRYYSG